MKPSRYGYLAGLALLLTTAMANAGECICSVIDSRTGVEIVPRHYIGCFSLKTDCTQLCDKKSYPQTPRFKAVYSWCGKPCPELSSIQSEQYRPTTAK
jgi:hypothetical protein